MFFFCLLLAVYSAYIYERSCQTFRFIQLTKKQLAAATAIEQVAVRAYSQRNARTHTRNSILTEMVVGITDEHREKNCPDVIIRR